MTSSHAAGSVPAQTSAQTSAMSWCSRALLVLYGVALLVAVLTSTSTDQAGVVQQATHALVDLGVSTRFATFDRVEMLANVVIVVPIGFLGVLSYPRTRWQSWTAYAFLGSLAVELAQGFLLPAREASTSDIVANTLGALLGAVVASLVLRTLAARRVPAPTRVR